MAKRQRADVPGANPENLIIEGNPFLPTDPPNVEPLAAHASRRRDTAPPENEREFEATFVRVAEAGQWHRRFHVIDQGPNANTRNIIAQLKQSGLDEAASIVGRIGYRRVTAKGFPDWFLCHDAYGVIVAELKSDRRDSNPTPDQWRWLTALARSMSPPENPYAASRVHLWRPQHWPAIETQLYVTNNPAPCNCHVCQYVAGGKQQNAPP